jgi:hypothetical protein
MSPLGGSEQNAPLPVPSNTSPHPFSSTSLNCSLFDGFVVGGAAGYFAGFEEAADGGVNVDHALFDASLDGARDLRGLAFADHVADGGRCEEDLHRCDAAGPKKTTSAPTVEYEINIKAELEVAHLHEKTDRIYTEMLERFVRMEGLLKGR